MGEFIVIFKLMTCIFFYFILFIYFFLFFIFIYLFFFLRKNIIELFNENHNIYDLNFIKKVLI